MTLVAQGLKFASPFIIIQFKINQPTRCNNFSSFLLDVYVRLNMFRTLHVHTCSGRNRIIPLMRRPNTDSTPKKPVTIQRNQLLIRYADTSLVHAVTIRCYDMR